MKTNGADATSALLSLDNLLQAVCGACGSAISIAAFYPLETVRTRLQVDAADLSPRSPILLALHIGRSEGVRSLYRGLPSLVLALSVTNFVYFYAFHGLRAMYDTNTASTDFICASIAGVVTVLVSNPLWVANTRLKLQGVAFKANEKGESKERRYNSVLDCIFGIAQHEGWQALWSGTSSSLMLISNPTIQYSCYEYLKRIQLENVVVISAISPHIRHLLNGAVSKFVATVCTYPLQVIQTQRRSGRFTEKPNPQMKKRSSFLSLIDQGSTIIKRDGMVGLFRGLESKLLQTVLSAALMFFMYEEMANFLFSIAGVVR